MHLVTAGGKRVLLDAGLFQGEKELRQRNWLERVPEAKRIDAIVLSHAHIDHTGYLPLLVRTGFRGPVYCTPATGALTKVLLLDSAYLQEEEAERANRHRYSRHHPALPLYTVEDAETALRLLQYRRFGKEFDPVPGMTVRYTRAGHILGAASIEVVLDGKPRRTLVFSGDIGRAAQPIIHAPDPPPAADVLLLESTYGDRDHPGGADEELIRVVREGAKRGGAILVPAFAVGRTQELIWRLRELAVAKRVPELPLYVDSPMAIDVTEMYSEHTAEHDEDMEELVRRGRDPLQSKRVTYTRSKPESQALNALQGPVIIISASGMATGGRILHHFNQRLGDPRTTVLLAGFQAPGTRGRALKEGARSLHIFGREVSVRAHIESIDALSAHADRTELLQWVAGMKQRPGKIYLVHGEPDAAAALAQALRRKRLKAEVATDGQTVSLD
jgi:metallo-beta-lactamase family protein